MMQGYEGLGFSIHSDHPRRAEHKDLGAKLIRLPTSPYWTEMEIKYQFSWGGIDCITRVESSINSEFRTNSRGVRQGTLLVELEQIGPDKLTLEGLTLMARLILIFHAAGSWIQGDEVPFDSFTAPAKHTGLPRNYVFDHVLENFGPAAVEEVVWP